MKLSTKNWASRIPNNVEKISDNIVIPLDNSSYAIWNRQVNPWPLDVPGKHEIPIVIRQWIEELNPISGHSVKDCIESQHLRAFEQCLEFTKSLIKPSSERFADKVTSYVETIRRELLIGTGLPETPHTAAYFLSLAAPDHPELVDYPFPYPTRGIIVHSIVLQPMNKDDVGGVAIGDRMLHQFHYYQPWSSEQLLRDAAIVARKHAEFWRKHPRSNGLSADLRQFNKRGPGEDPISKDIVLYKNKEIDYDMLLTREIQRSVEIKGELLTPKEKQDIEKRIRQRLKRNNIEIPKKNSAR